MTDHTRVDRPSLSMLLALVTLGACGVELTDPATDSALETPAITRALDATSPDAIERHIRTLADDRMEGRAPGTRGFEQASRYVEDVFESLGLEPLGADGTFRQPVPLQASAVDESRSAFAVSYRGGTMEFGYGEDFTLLADPVREQVNVHAPVVFVGFGVTAPQLGYDDYADIDVEGKIVAFLTGAPAAFPSNQRAYFSSGLVKREEAEERGAVGIVSFTYPDDPRFRWAVEVAQARGGSFTWFDEQARPQGEPETSPIRGSASMNQDAARALFQGSPVDIDEVFRTAADGRPQAFDLAVEVGIRTTSTHRAVESHNLVARLAGSDPDLRDEHVVYVAHLDHFGIGTPVNGDSIYNGAHDNASGTSIALEVARTFSALPRAPRRSMIFLIATAEEWGLLGSDYFVKHPPVEKSSLVANLSLDMPFLFYPLLDIVAYGAEHSSLSGAVGAAAEIMGVSISPDPQPEQVLFIRSDHFSFVRQGIPALFIKSGFETGDDRDGGQIHDEFRAGALPHAVRRSRPGIRLGPPGSRWFT